MASSASLTLTQRARAVQRGARLALVALALACGFVVGAGCVPRQTALHEPPGPFTGGPPRRGGHAVFVREEDPDYLDPALSYGAYSAPMIEGVFRTLLEYVNAPGVAGATLRPELTTSLPDIREGGTLYCFRIRPDAKFGPPLHRHITAADFKYSLERLFRIGSPGIGFYREIVGADRVIAGKDSALAGVIARGDSLYVRIQHSDPVFLQELTMSFSAPIPREVAERYSGTFSQHTVSSGPFMVAEFVPRQRVLLVRNPDWCGEPAYLDTFEIRLGVTAANAVALIRRGEADGGMFEVPAAEFPRLLRDSTWRHQVDVEDGLNTEYLYMNVEQPPFNDVRVRQAINWAIDRRPILKVWSGKGVAAGEFLPPGMPGASALHAYMPADPARARRLLAEAGYPNGFSTTLYGWTIEPGPRQLTVIQQQLANVGIHARLDLGEVTGYTSMAEDTSRHIGFGLYSWYADYVDPSNFCDVLLNGRRLQAIHNEDLSMMNDPRLNAMIVEAMATAEPTLRAARWRAVDSLTMVEAPVAPLLHHYDSRLYSPRIGGWYRHITRILMIDKLWIKSPPSAPVAQAAR
ncbi:MAG TPA: ABC transporter substrate-binding protein [Candidatus Eisenbacteria bacterium]|nr:ABC transporter substrate-binding protein [Candidatus Eisenbacteria bacterium]